MNIDSSRELKDRLFAEVAGMFIRPVREARSASITGADVVLARVAAERNCRATFALGLALSGSRAGRGRSGAGVRIAVRIQSRQLEGSAIVDMVTKRARGEVEVRYIGRVGALASRRAGAGRARGVGDVRWESDWMRRRRRPLAIGASIGFEDDTVLNAGTLGCFVRRGASGSPMILSNNHVIAKENRLRPGGAILQPGSLDGGGGRDRVAKLSDFARLRPAPRKSGVDAAAALLLPGVEFDPTSLRGLTLGSGALRGVAKGGAELGAVVGKVGRSTGATVGRISAIEVDEVLVNYAFGAAVFDGQVEIEGDGTRGGGPFSAPGDSGSIIVDADGMAVGLLFAGSDHGGAGGRGLTYANPIGSVLRALKVSVITG